MNIPNGVINPVKIAKTDYIAGAINYEKLNKLGDWTKYLPIGEKQHSIYFDTMGCVSFSFLNTIEIQFKFMIDKGLMPATHIKFLEDNGYLVNGEVNLSDRHLAKESGTTRRGNYLVKVADAGRNKGLLPEQDWLYPVDQRNPIFDWDDYYKEIPQELKDKALRFRDYFEIKYEWLSLSYDLATNDEIREELKHAPLQLAAPVCPTVNGVKEECGKNTATHATTIYDIGDYIYQFDHYDPFKKRLALDYYTPWIMKNILIIKNKDMPTLTKDKDDNQYITFDEAKFACSIPEPKMLPDIKHHFKFTDEPVYRDLTGYYVYHGTTAFFIKEFFNL